MFCKNCNHTTEGNYCSHCGQKTDVTKITVSNLLSQLSDSILQVDRGFFFTLKELFTRPGTTIREYLDGKRKRHFKPVAYMLTLSTIYFLVSKISGQNTMLDEFLTGSTQGILGIEDKKEIPVVVIWFSKNYAYTALLLLPAFSLASYLCFLRSGANYLEHFVIGLYLTGQQAIFYILFTLLNTIIDREIMEVIPIFVGFIYTIWVYAQFFKNKKLVSIIIQSILTYFLYFIISNMIVIPIIGLFELVG